MAFFLTLLTGCAVLAGAFAANGIEILGSGGLIGGNTVSNPTGAASAFASGKDVSVASIGNNPSGGDSLIAIAPNNQSGGLSAVNIGSKNGLNVGLLDIGGGSSSVSGILSNGQPSNVTGQVFTTQAVADWMANILNSAQKILDTPPVKAGMWIHGSGAQLEKLNWTAVRKTMGAMVTPFQDQLWGWVHFPVPTPTMQNNSPLKFGAASLRFETGKDCKIATLVVADADGNPANENQYGYALTGPKQVATYQFVNGSTVYAGADFAAEVRCVSSGPDAWVNFIGAGIDFV